jgi:diguanylate cyclase (GGDEF)-like protein
LTGLANRRRLFFDLKHELRDASSERPLLLLLFDLDGFKAYNDNFGHLAGDALLKRLGQSLSAATRGSGGVAYRMGGDEFCVLGSGHSDRVELMISAAEAALKEEGEGFSISASYGGVLLPGEATDPSEALRLADQRMYLQKASSRPSAAGQSTSVLRVLLSERDAELANHIDGVEDLCERTGQKLGLVKEQMISLMQAASLHDIGKLAIPDAILDKEDPLNEDEWAFIRRHTVIGERILGAAPALLDTSKLVRATHEQFDGSGYPDGLVGDAIPLGARIIAVCDAYDAMTSNRKYRTAMSSEGAIDELRRCSGTQFDPAVVEAFCSVIFERERESESVPVKR